MNALNTPTTTSSSNNTSTQATTTTTSGGSGPTTSTKAQTVKAIFANSASAVMSGVTPQIISITTPTGGLNQTNIHQAVPISINSSLSHVLRHITTSGATPIHVATVPTQVVQQQQQQQQQPVVVQAVATSEITTTTTTAKPNETENGTTDNK